jgi:hypothetical protein
MRRSIHQRASTGRRVDRRVLAGLVALVALGAVAGVAQMSSAETGPGGADGQNNGLAVLGRDCAGSDLTPHDGFQNGNRCVATEFGEVSEAAKNPALLIARFPRTVRANEPFRLQVSTVNLVRDRFLGAGAGGYYLESSFLNAAGLQRGHFHAACRMLESTREAPNPEPVPAFFRAVEDGGGGANPDTVTVEVTAGMPTAGTAQCAVWAGDGSHRLPMMQRANQTPAFDAVRIRVREAEPQPEQPPAGEPEPEQPPAAEPEPEQPPANDDPPATDDDAQPQPADDNDGATRDENPPAAADGNDEAAEPAAVDVERETTGIARPVAANRYTPAEQAPQAPRGGLALTGANAIAIIAGGVVLLVGGLLILGSTRRRTYY